MTAMAHAYVVLVSRRGVLPEVAVTAVRGRATEHLPFAPTNHLVWHSNDRRVAVVCFAAPSALEVGSYWDVTDEGIVAFSGLPVPRRTWWRAEHSWAAQIRAWSTAWSVERAAAEAYGVFTMLRLDAAGAGTLCTDPLGVGVLYRADGPHWTAIATRASLAGVAAAPDMPLRCDLRSLGWLMSFDNLIGDGTGHAGVRALPPRTVVRIGDGLAADVRPLPEPGGDSVAAADAATAEICDHLRSVAGAPVQRSVGLTGGRDSRLLLAHILHAGLQHRFRFITWDLDPGDVEVATTLARRYDLDHFVIPVNDPPDWLAALQALQDQTDGMLPATSVGKVMETDGLFLSGGAGELLCAYYGRHRSVRSHSHVRRLFDQQVRRRAEETLCRPVAVAWYAGEVQRLLDTYAGIAPERVPQMVYLDHRLHRWKGTVRESASRADAIPLLSPIALGGALLTPHDSRRRYDWHRELWKRTVPELAELPFGGGGGMRHTVGTASLDRWQTLEGVAGDVLLGDSDNPVFALIDRERVEQAISASEPPTPTVSRQIVTAIGLATWARRDHHPRRSSTPSPRRQVEPWVKDSGPVAHRPASQPTISG